MNVQSISTMSSVRGGVKGRSVLRGGTLREGEKEEVCGWLSSCLPPRRATLLALVLADLRPTCSHIFVKVMDVLVKKFAYGGKMTASYYYTTVHSL